jgi:glycerate kinase
MPKRILIVPDKFKGTLTARAAAEAIAAGWRRVWPEDTLELLPMSDGGDGFGEIISGLLQAQAQSVRTVDAAHRPCEAAWWWHGPSRSAVIESARVIGLALLPKGRYHPFELDTFGLGAVLEAALKMGARQCLVGIGGSATNDGGFGLAHALGWQFFDRQGARIMRWAELHRLARLRAPNQPQRFEDLTVAVDVQNPLLGPNGCTRIYGPQKGIRPDEFEFAERCLGQLAEIVRQELDLDDGQEPGAGAAGGLGFGLRCFAGARLEPGFALFARLASLPERVKSAQLVITGEGALDRSTFMGKGVGEVARLCRQLDVPCLGFAGMAPDRDETGNLFRAIHALTPDLTTDEHAMQEPAIWLERLALHAAQRWKH